MHYYKKSFLFFILLIPMYCFSDQSSSYWKCVTSDNTKREWVAQSIYQKIALNIAFAACKRESRNPKSCTFSAENCEGYNRFGRSTTPSWICTALDAKATSWRSNPHLHRDDAAIAAKELCKNHSRVPGSCYVSLIGCINLHSEFQS